MSLKQTLQKVEADIQQGDYGKARDRLHGLISSYPDDLSIRRKLGEIYWKLQFPAMAGRYWYLEDDKSPEMEIACKSFESTFGNNVMKMLFAIKFQGDFRLIEEHYAGRVLLNLHEQAKEKYRFYVDFRNKRANKFYQSPKGKNKNSLFIAIGCLIFLVVLIGLVGIGLVTIAGWIF